MPYPRTVEELKENAVIYWPSEIAEKERNSSIIPLLLATQDHFISVPMVRTLFDRSSISQKF